MFAHYNIVSFDYHPISMLINQNTNTLKVLYIKHYQDITLHLMMIYKEEKPKYLFGSVAKQDPDFLKMKENAK
jgi:hypothetical protein